MNIAKRVRWKFLLGVFKLKRYAKKWFGMRRLDYDKKDIFILTDTLREYDTRARSVQKEPKTVEWIDRHAKSGTVLYDIGANVGAYSLVAAVQGAKVIAFEPAHQNIYKLHENILLNKVNDKITVVPLILEAQSGTATSFIKDRGFGASHSFSLTEKHSDIFPSQTFLALELDQCISLFSLPEPTMMKIDVDGAEIEVLRGAKKLLEGSTLKHLLVEIDHKNTEIIRLIEEAGFKVVDQERSGDDNTNYIFERP